MSPDVIGDVVARNGARFGDKAALVSTDGVATSFADFARRVADVANRLAKLGLRRGTRVAILARNRPEFLEVVAAASAGFVAVPLNWRLSKAEIGAILADCAPEIIVCDAGFTALIDGLRGSVPSLRHLVCFDGPRPGWEGYESLLAPLPHPEVLAAGEPRRTAAGGACFEAGLRPAPQHEEVGGSTFRPRPEDTACIVYTSGTTGRPKGAELTHRGLLLNCRSAMDDLLGLTSDDVTLAPMPFFHVGGLWYHLFPSFSAGCTTYVLPEFDPGAVLWLIAERRVTNLHVVPTMLHALLAHPDLATTDLSSLRLVFYAASSIPVALLKRAVAAFAGCGFVQGYGSTEAGMVTRLGPADHLLAVSAPEHEHLLASCGRALPGVELRLAEPEAGPDGEPIGEIVVRSPMTMARYWRNPDATAAVRIGDWLRTGDLARQDEAGYAYVLDRKSDMIVTGGENVFPREVEEVLLLDPNLAEAAVFDLPDDRWVQKVVAAVVPKPGADPAPAAIIAAARTRLAAYKCPKEVFVVEALPKNGAGKVLRKALRAGFAPAAFPT